MYYLKKYYSEQGMVQGTELPGPVLLNPRPEAPIPKATGALGPRLDAPDPDCAECARSASGGTESGGTASGGTASGGTGSGGTGSKGAGSRDAGYPGPRPEASGYQGPRPKASGTRVRVRRRRVPGSASGGAGSEGAGSKGSGSRGVRRRRVQSHRGLILLRQVRRIRS